MSPWYSYDEKNKKEMPAMHKGDRVKLVKLRNPNAPTRIARLVGREGVIVTHIMSSLSNGAHRVRVKFDPTIAFGNMYQGVFYESELELVEPGPYRLWEKYKNKYDLSQRAYGDCLTLREILTIKPGDEVTFTDGPGTYGEYLGQTYEVERVVEEPCTQASTGNGSPIKIFIRKNYSGLETWSSGYNIAKIHKKNGQVVNEPTPPDYSHQYEYSLDRNFEAIGMGDTLEPPEPVKIEPGQTIQMQSDMHIGQEDGYIKLERTCCPTVKQLIAALSQVDPDLPVTIQIGGDQIINEPWGITKVEKATKETEKEGTGWVRKGQKYIVIGSHY